ncbi:band 4.1-like protein 4A [Trichonephila clavipes]|nr:band 4.1-like protein 4A [Trichonephila clavipes]
MEIKIPFYSHPQTRKDPVGTALHIQEANMDDTTQTKTHTERAAAGYMTTEKRSKRDVSRDIGFYTDVEDHETSRGQQLLDVVFKHLNLMETAYFGLRFMDATGQRHWLDPNKNIVKQMKDAVAFPSYPRHARLERDLAIWLTKGVFDKLQDSS